MIMITVADSGNHSLMEALQESEIQILICGSCYHHNPAHYCANWSHQLPYSLKLVIFAIKAMIMITVADSGTSLSLMELLQDSEI